MTSRFFSNNVGRFSLIFACVAFLASCDRLLTPGQTTDIAELRSGAYTLDTDHAALLFKINHLGFSTFVGRFTDFDATLDFDPENIENSSMEVIVEMASINVNIPEFEEELRGDNWLDVEAFPQAVYRTTSFVESIDENTFIFAGDLTFHGVTKPVNLEITFHGGGRNFLTRSYTLGFSAEASFLRSDFGVDRFTSFGVGDEITLEIHVEFMDAS
ncbi:MAG: YceI family protein [Gammaproteobacteria bacterium]|nr:YceI family protein [Pseudomonadales bacterium]MCP5347055.1 YceI family protein [Pseudomonadales bacterium]